MSNKIAQMIETERLHQQQAVVLAEAVRGQSTTEIRFTREISLRDAPMRNIRQLAVKLIAERDGWDCYLCGRVLNAASAVVEHIIPLCRGGTDEPQNVGLSCTRCNERKALCYVSIDVNRRAVYHRSE